MNLENKLDLENLLKIKNKISRVFFYRVCGTGMGACACLLREKGFLVEGGDHHFYPPMSDYLQSTGIKTHQLKDMSTEYLKEFDLIIVGNVIPKGSEDAKLIEDCGVKYASFPNALGALVLKDQNVIGIAGTHGKTTTTYFLAQMFEFFGLSPGYFIGGVMEGRPPSRLGGGKYFFIESDEYDSAYFEKISKFHFYFLDHLIITSLEYDHADIFDNIEQIKDQFRQVIPGVGGSHIYSDDYHEVVNLKNEYSHLSITSYGEKSECGPFNIQVKEGGSFFELKCGSEKVKFQTSIIGLHNILNISSGILFAHSEGIEVEKIQESIKNLKLVKRRQEVKGYFGKSIVIDDFAHHPRAVKLTIDAVKDLFPNKEMLVVLEPHSATARSSIFQNEFTEALRLADTVFITKLSKATTAKGASDLDLEKMVLDLRKNGTFASCVSSLDDLRLRLDDYKKRESVILILSNGTCLGLWQSSFNEELKNE